MAFGFGAAPLVMRIPSGRKKTVEPLDVAALEPLATTRELREILVELKASDLPDLRDAWLDAFAAKARCPQCDGPLRHRRGKLASACGWRVRP